MVRFDEYHTLIRIFRRLLIKNIHFRDGLPWEQHLLGEGRALIVASHGPVIGALLWLLTLFPRMVELGYGHLEFSAISHPIIRNIPIFARMVGYEKKQEQRLRTDDYIELLKKGRINVLSVAPEGEYCLYGNGIDIQPFRSNRSLEIALEADCRVVLVVARGFEHWQRGLSIESPLRKKLVKALVTAIPFLNKMDEQALAEARQLSISGFFGRIPNVWVASELFEPELRAEDLAEDRATRDLQLKVEGDRMRQQMIRMVDELKAEPDRSER